MLGRIRLCIVCYYNSLVLWAILYGCLSSLTGLFCCVFLIVVNIEVLKFGLVPRQQHEYGLIFRPNKQRNLPVLSCPKNPL